MIKKIIPFCLLAFTVGFMACSSSGQLAEKVQTNITNKKYDAAINAADTMIQRKPKSPIGYYYKGVALGQKAQAQEPPSEGTPFFKEMDGAFSKAKEVASNAKKVPDEIKRIPSVRKSFWRVAHNKGIKLLQNDSLRKTFEQPMQRSLAFLNNARIADPGHAVTYQAIAIVSGRTKNYKKAAKAQKKFISMADSLTVRNYLVLTQYYRRADMPEAGLKALEEAQNKYPDNSKITAFLADTYTQLGKTKKAIALVEKLVEQNPENPQYHLSLGSRILISSSKLQDKYEDNVNKIFELQRKIGNASSSEAEQIKQKVESLKQKNTELANEIRDFQDRAEEQFKLVLKYRPDDATAYNNIGVIYQNRAALYYDLRNLAQSKSKAKEYDSKADSLLKEAVEYYKKAVEIEPNNKKYWRSLYIVYTNLGKDKKANKAARKAGIK